MPDSSEADFLIFSASGDALGESDAVPAVALLPHDADEREGRLVPVLVEQVEAVDRDRVPAGLVALRALLPERKAPTLDRDDLVVAVRPIAGPQAVVDRPAAVIDLALEVGELRLELLLVDQEPLVHLARLAASCLELVDHDVVDLDEIDVELVVIVREDLKETCALEGGVVEREAALLVELEQRVETVRVPLEVLRAPLRRPIGVVGHVPRADLGRSNDGGDGIDVGRDQVLDDVRELRGRR